MFSYFIQSERAVPQWDIESLGVIGRVVVVGLDLFPIVVAVITAIAIVAATPDKAGVCWFEGVCLTHVILAPGACGWVALNTGFGSLPLAPVARVLCSGDLNF